MNSYQYKINQLKHQVKTYERELEKVKDRSFITTNKTIKNSLDRVILAYKSKIDSCLSRIKVLESEL